MTARDERSLNSPPGQGGDPLRALLAQWDAEEAILRRRGATQAAETLRSCATELHAALEAHRLETLTLREAAAEAGMTYKGLQKAVSEGRIRNAGARHRPLVRRADLPRKVTPPPTRGGPDLVGEALGLAPAPDASLA